VEDTLKTSPTGKAVQKNRIGRSGRNRRSAHAEHDAGLGEVVGRHLHFDFVPDDESDEAFAHFSGDVGEHLVTAGKFHTEHRSGKHCGNFAFDLDGLFFVVFGLLAFVRAGSATAAAIATAAASTTSSAAAFPAVVAAITTWATGSSGCTRAA
jgi:hypothetical protein